MLAPLAQAASSIAREANRRSPKLKTLRLFRSSLLIMVSAFASRERILAAYRHAASRGFRFFSYGDAMFVERHDR